MERTVRLERLLVTSSAMDDTGVINTQTLSSALELEDRLTRHLSSLPNSKCITRRKRECITVSPLELWGHDEYSLRADTNLLHTINTTKNLTVAGLPINTRMVFAGREADESTKSSLEFASYLSIVFFFLEDDCTGSSGHDAWIQSLREILPSNVELITKPQEPQLMALQVSFKSCSPIAYLTLCSLILTRRADPQCQGSQF
jgi:hypothetical protein